jgi:hypothetical protein
MREDDLKREVHENDDKKNRIRIMKNEFDRIADEFKREKELKERELKT